MHFTAAQKVVEYHPARELSKMNETIEDLHSKINELKQQKMHMNLKFIPL